MLGQFHRHTLLIAEPYALTFPSTIQANVTLARLYGQFGSVHLVQPQGLVCLSFLPENRLHTSLVEVNTHSLFKVKLAGYTVVLVSRCPHQQEYIIHIDGILSRCTVGIRLRNPAFSAFVHHLVSILLLAVGKLGSTLASILNGQHLTLLVVRFRFPKQKQAMGLALAGLAILGQRLVQQVCPGEPAVLLGAGGGPSWVHLKAQRSHIGSIHRLPGIVVQQLVCVKIPSHHGKDCIQRQHHLGQLVPALSHRAYLAQLMDTFIHCHQCGGLPLTACFHQYACICNSPLCQCLGGVIQHHCHRTLPRYLAGKASKGTVSLLGQGHGIGTFHLLFLLCHGGNGRGHGARLHRGGAGHGRGNRTARQ